MLTPIYGMEGTILIFGGFAFNAVVCALLLQPASWHVKKGRDIEKSPNIKNVNAEELPMTDKVQRKDNYHKNHLITYINNIRNNYNVKKWFLSTFKACSKK